MPDPMQNHKCTKIADLSWTCSPERAFWIGQLDEPLPGNEQETHCIHITTPYKSVVFGVNHSDAGFMAVAAQVLQGTPVNQRWIDSMEKKARHEAERTNA